MTDLKLGPLQKIESVRLSITLSKPLMEAMEQYALDFSEQYEKADVPALIPHMLDAFLRSDKAFMKRHADSIRAQAARTPQPLPSAAHRLPEGG
jgi:hypothetical protein